MIQYLSLSSANPLLSLKWVKLCARSPPVRWFDKVPENLSAKLIVYLPGRVQSDLLDFFVVIVIVAGRDPEIFPENVLTRTADFRTGGIYLWSHFSAQAHSLVAHESC